MLAKKVERFLLSVRLWASVGPGCPERFKMTTGGPCGSRCESYHQTRLLGD